MRAWLVLVVAAVLASASSAHATCILREATSPNDAPLPLRGSVYAYVDSTVTLPIEVTWASGNGSVETARLSQSVRRIDYAGNDGAVLVVNGTSYKLSASASNPRVPKITSMRRTSGSWTCSSYDYLGIALDSSPAAVRARWTRGGVVSEYWLVPQDRVIELGEVNCGGTTLPPSELDAGGRLALFAVFVDGTEQLISDEPVFPRDFVDTQARVRHAAVAFGVLLGLLGLVAFGLLSPNPLFAVRTVGERGLARATLHRR